MILKLPCKPFVADYLRKRLGEKIRITARGKEMETLAALMDGGENLSREQIRAEKLTDFVHVEFPRLFVFKSGKVCFPSTTVIAFNSFIRDLLAEGMNDWVDGVQQYTNAQELDLIVTYLTGKGVSIDNINLDTWKKIRYRHKKSWAENLKNLPPAFVPENLHLSSNGKNSNRKA